MKTTIVLATLGLGLGLTANLYAAPADVLATVNGTNITEKMFETYAKQRGLENTAKIPPERKRQIVEELVNRTLLARAAAQKNLDKQPEFALEIESARLNILASATIRTELQAAGDIGDDKLKEAYQKFIGDKPKTEFKARHMLAQSEDVAKGWITQLDKGTTFEKLSSDSANGASEAGELDWFEPDQMLESFSTAVMQLKKGEYTKTPVHTQYGWHVIQLEDTRAATPPPFESIKDQLLMNVRNSQIENIIKGLRDKAKIEIK